ncbi:MAG: Rid family detoxifying hydrolase [Candidatus Sumerlaeota bacterium]|nr:Rid family detoxifying hydrolase [Candidatus Sumerlaeota bacterium]
MSAKVVVASPGAPKAIGPYSAGIKAGGFLFLSGQLGIDPASGQLAGPGIAQQSERALTSLQSLLDVNSLSMASVVKTTVYLKSMDDFPEMNKVYERFFVFEPPARSTVEVARLPKDALVEIDAIAML